HHVHWRPGGLPDGDPDEPRRRIVQRPHVHLRGDHLCVARPAVLCRAAHHRYQRLDPGQHLQRPVGRVRRRAEHEHDCRDQGRKVPAPRRRL
ncbi:hypothetical protein H4R21_004913, partial [Coemansia helicoidea]